MSAVERLHAAIEKLEAYRDLATQGEWVCDFEIGGEIHAVGDTHTGGSAFIGKPAFHDAWLIVTLHRTIDAQLAILRFGVKRLAAVQTLTGKHAEAHAHELALADAILGSTS